MAQRRGENNVHAYSAVEAAQVVRKSNCHKCCMFLCDRMCEYFQTEFHPLRSTVRQFYAFMYYSISWGFFGLSRMGHTDSGIVIGPLLTEKKNAMTAPVAPKKLMSDYRHSASTFYSGAATLTPPTLFFFLRARTEKRRSPPPVLHVPPPFGHLVASGAS